jgi:hypothetical protein
MKQIPLVLDQDYPRCCKKLALLHNNETASFAISTVMPEFADHNGIASTIGLDAMIAPLYKFKDRELNLHFLCFANDSELKEGLAHHASEVYKQVPDKWKVTAYSGIDQTDHALNKVTNVKNGCHLDYSTFEQDVLDKAKQKGFESVYLYGNIEEKSEWDWHKLLQTLKENQGLNFLIKLPKLVENSFTNLEAEVMMDFQNLKNLEFVNGEEFWNKAFNIRPRVVVPVYQE